MARVTKWSTICLCVLIAMGGMASAQATGEPEDAVELFFSGLRAGEIGAALKRIASGSSIAEQEQQLRVLESQIATGQSLYGNPVGQELVFREPLGESVLRLVYLQKFERLPLVWEFYFYRTRSRWILINIQFQDQLDLLKTVR